MIQDLKIPQPIIGLGHSMGGGCIAYAAMLHPSVFTALVCLDPVLHKSFGKGPQHNPIAIASAKRLDIWKSQEDAEKYFRSRKFYKTWDERAIQAMLKYGLRPLPTFIYPDIKEGVTLSTTKHQEVFTYMKPCDKNDEVVGTDDGTIVGLRNFEPEIVYQGLKDLKIPVQYIFGSESNINTPDGLEAKINGTPNRIWENVEGWGHLFPFEHMKETADKVVPFLDAQMKDYRKKRQIAETSFKNVRLGNEYLRYLNPKKSNL